MSEVISWRELRNASGRIMQSLDEGLSFVVARSGQPVGELRPLHRPRLVDVHAVRVAFRKSPAIDANRFRHDVDEALDQGIDPRD